MMSSLPPVIFFDDRAESRFGPLTELRAASELRCGAFSLEEKLLRRLGSAGIRDITRSYDTPTGTIRFSPTLLGSSQSVIFLSIRALLRPEAVDVMTNSRTECRFESTSGSFLGARFSTESIIRQGDDWADTLVDTLSKRIPRLTIPSGRMDYPWHLVQAIREEIAFDLALADADDAGVANPLLPADVTTRGGENIRITGQVFIGPGVILDAESEQIRLDEGSRIDAGAMLVALDGPIWIARNARVMPGAILTGPVYVGPSSIIRPGARLNGAVAVGPYCRVGGEVSGALMQGYSNKQHSGYLGASFVGEWVNLGAATDNSDLKNNYRPIEVTLDGQIIDSGDLHVGVFLGDFVRTAIHTRLNSGTAVGSCCNLFGADFPDKAVPPFIWFGSSGYQECRLDKALETIRVVMSRRGRELDARLEAALNDLFDRSRDERAEFLGRVGRPS